MKFKMISRLYSVLSMCILPMTAYAGGMMLYEISSADTRLASAGWSSRAEDPSTLFTNPAGMSRFCTPEIEFGLQGINAHIIFDPNEETNVLGTRGTASIWLPSGSFFYVQPVTESITLGFGSLSYFGADLGFNGNWVGRYYVTHTTLEGFSAVPAASYQLTDDISVGIGINVMYGLFRQKSHINNMLDGLPDGELKLNGRHLAVGAVVGILYELTPCTRFGLQYLSPVKLTFHDTPDLFGVGPTLETFIDRAGLRGTTVKVIARVPQSVMLSAYHAFDECWTAMVDVGWQQWSRFQKVAISLSDPNATTLSTTLKYEDTWHIALGSEYHFNPCWTFSAGVAYDSSAVTNAHRALDFPIGQQWRFGTGARWYFSSDLIFDFCYEFQWTGDLPVNVNRGRLAGHVDGKFHNVYGQYINANLTWVF